MPRRLRLLVFPAAVAVLMVCSGQPSAAPAGLGVTLSTFSGSATYGEDLSPESDTPIFFTERITWSLAGGAAHRRIGVGQTVTVPVRIKVTGSAHGAYAIVDQTTTLVPYSCSASAVHVQQARVRLSRSAAAGNRLTATLIRAGALATGPVTCTDAEQARTFEFPTGSRWVADRLGSRVLVSRLGEQIDRTTSQTKVVHRCGSQPTCVERLQFRSRLKFTARH